MGYEHQDESFGVIDKEDGRGMSSGVTMDGSMELMYGADMKVLVKSGSDPVEIVALLGRIANWIMRYPDLVTQTHWPPEDEIDRIRNKLDTALGSSSHDWETPLGDLVGGELTDILKDGRADDDIVWMRAAEAKFDQYCRCL